MDETDSTEQRLVDAVLLAHRSHHGQTRRLKGDAYMGHVFAVTGIVIESGGDEDEAIGALLHDVVEDGGATVGEIRARFGSRVAEIVDYMTEPPVMRSYRERKTAYIDRLAKAPARVLRVAVADKLHNAETSLRNLHEGYDMLAEFPSLLWYLDALLAAFKPRVPADAGIDALVARFEEAVTAVHAEVGE